MNCRRDCQGICGAGDDGSIREARDADMRGARPWGLALTELFLRAHRTLRLRAGQCQCSAVWLRVPKCPVGTSPNGSLFELRLPSFE
jgi:hypothetical protein